MKPMMIATIAGEAVSAAAFWTYIAYLLISVALTIWVARTLHKNGRIFLVDSLLGNEPLADSVNHLLVVGFYLINIGFVTLALKYGDKATDAATALESLSGKVGRVLVVLGAMHFLNLVGKTAQRPPQPFKFVSIGVHSRFRTPRIIADFPAPLRMMGV